MAKAVATHDDPAEPRGGKGMSTARAKRTPQVAPRAPVSRESLYEALSGERPPDVEALLKSWQHLV